MCKIAFWEATLAAGHQLEPECSLSFEQWDELATEVERHDLVGGADKAAADEHDGDAGPAADGVDKSFLHLPPSGILVQLMNGRVDTHIIEEPLDRMTHATGAQTKDHHRILSCQFVHPVH